MKKSIIPLFALTVLLGSCAHQEGPYIPVTQSPSVEDLYPVVLLDESLQGFIAVDHTEGQRLSDGRLEIVANLRNRTLQDVRIQVQTVFKDEKGYSTNEDSAWAMVFLNANETETYKIVSRGQDASRYTIRIRRVR